MTTTRSLDGVRVLDVTQVMAGPFCAMLLCDMGADVIKVEPPGGDSTRRMPGAIGTDSPSFNAVNRGKRAVVLDLTHAEGRDAARRLALASDVLVENYRPGVMAKFGLGYEELSQEHPRLVYASISGYGQTGPAAAKGGFDLVAQGVSGLMSITGEPGRPPVKVGVPITDLGAGLFAVTGILSALLARATTGRGQHVDTSLVDAGVALSVWEATQYFSGRGVPEPLGSAHRMNAPYEEVRCAEVAPSTVLITQRNRGRVTLRLQGYNRRPILTPPHIDMVVVQHHRRTNLLPPLRKKWTRRLAGVGLKLEPTGCCPNLTVEM